MSILNSSRRMGVGRVGFAVVVAAALGSGTAIHSSAPALAIVSPPTTAYSVPTLLSPLDPATGDPAPPDGTPVPDGLDEPAPDPDDSVIEFPPPPAPGLIPNANTVRMAWIGSPEQRPDDAALLTLQAAISAAPAGGTVSFDPSDYAFSGSLTVARSVTLDTASPSVLYTRFTVSGGELRLDDDVSVGIASTGATIAVTGSGVALIDVTVSNPNGVARPTGIQVGAGLTGVVISRFTMDGGGVVSSFGVNLTTASAVVTDPDISAVATGVTVTAASTAPAVTVEGGTIEAGLSGLSLGTTAGPQVIGTTVVGPDNAGTGIDLANSSSATITSVAVTGFARGIGTATTNTGTGATITDATITGSSREGIALGSTTSPNVVRANITGSGSPQSTGILLLRSTGARVEAPTITGMMYGITTHLDNVGAGPIITSPRITAFGAITLGSTQGAVISDSVLDAGTWGVAGTGINLVNAGRVTVTNVTGTGFLYVVGSQSSFTAASDRAEITISGARGSGAPDASSGVYLLGATGATISDVDVELTGAALVIHQSVDVRAQDIVVRGRSGPTSVTGAAILRAYGSQDVHVNRSSIDAGSYGFFYSDTHGATVTNAVVAGVEERALYGRSVSDLEVSSSSFTGNAAAGAFVVTTPENGISHDISIHDNVMTDNGSGLHFLQGTTGTQVLRNTASGQPDVVTAGGAHDLLIADNIIDQGADAVAIVVAPLWQDGADPGSYSSSDIRVQNNVFTGAGTAISVGTEDPTAPEAERRTLRDPVLATGNTFPAASAAIRVFSNAAEGIDAAGIPLRSLPGDSPVAVDARDYDDPNDWGSECRASGYLDGALFYDGGGAAVYELTEAAVLYPMNCIDLALEQSLTIDEERVVRPGDLVTWTLTPQNAGPRAAPAGWTITQLLPEGVELVSMTGSGYLVSASTAKATADLPTGETGPTLSVVARIISVPDGVDKLRDVAYIAPGSTRDLDDDGFDDIVFEHLSPLVIPTIDTDTAASATDNDTQGSWRVAGGAAPPSPGGEGGPSGLAFTGTEVGPAAILGLLLAVTGFMLLRTRRTYQRIDAISKLSA